MNKANIIPLFQILPVTKSKGFAKKIFDDKNEEIKNRNRDSEDTGMSTEEPDNFEFNNWVKENAERGAEGEQYIKDILINRYDEKNVKKEPDHMGYDFSVITNTGILRIEVKTTVNKKYPIFMSINEMKKANFYKLDYFIYYVIIEQNKRPYVYVINDPISNLLIDMEYIERSYKSEYCLIGTDKFAVKINTEFLESMELL